MGTKGWWGKGQHLMGVKELMGEIMARRNGYFCEVGGFGTLMCAKG